MAQLTGNRSDALGFGAKFICKNIQAPLDGSGAAVPVKGTVIVSSQTVDGNSAIQTEILFYVVDSNVANADLEYEGELMLNYSDINSLGAIEEEGNFLIKVCDADGDEIVSGNVKLPLGINDPPILKIVGADPLEGGVRLLVKQENYPGYAFKPTNEPINKWSVIYSNIDQGSGFATIDSVEAVVDDKISSLPNHWHLTVSGMVEKESYDFWVKASSIEAMGGHETNLTGVAGFEAQVSANPNPLDNLQFTSNDSGDTLTFTADWSSVGAPTTAKYGFIMGTIQATDVGADDLPNFDKDLTSSFQYPLYSYDQNINAVLIADAVEVDLPETLFVKSTISVADISFNDVYEKNIAVQMLQIEGSGNEIKYSLPSYSVVRNTKLPTIELGPPQVNDDFSQRVEIRGTYMPPVTPTKDDDVSGVSLSYSIDNNLIESNLTPIAIGAVGDGTGMWEYAKTVVISYNPDYTDKYLQATATQDEPNQGTPRVVETDALDFKMKMWEDPVAGTLQASQPKPGQDLYGKLTGNDLNAEFGWVVETTSLTVTGYNSTLDASGVTYHSSNPDISGIEHGMDVPGNVVSYEPGDYVMTFGYTLKLDLTDYKKYNSQNETFTIDSSGVRYSSRASIDGIVYDQDTGSLTFTGNTNGSKEPTLHAIAANKGNEHKLWSHESFNEPITTPNADEHDFTFDISFNLITPIPADDLIVVGIVDASIGESTIVVSEGVDLTQLTT